MPDGLEKLRLRERGVVLRHLSSLRASIASDQTLDGFFCFILTTVSSGSTKALTRFRRAICP